MLIYCGVQLNYKLITLSRFAWQTFNSCCYHMNDKGGLKAFLHQRLLFCNSEFCHLVRIVKYHINQEENALFKDALLS